MDNKLKQLLYESFDRKLTTREQDILNKALTESVGLQSERKHIIEMRKKLSDSNKQKFEPFFADQVMSKVREIHNQNNSSEFFESIALLFRPVAIAATVIIITIVSINLLKSNQISLEGAIAIPEVTINDAYDPLLDLNLE